MTDLSLLFKPVCAIMMDSESELKLLLVYFRQKMAVSNLMHELEFHPAYLVGALLFE